MIKLAGLRYVGKIGDFVYYYRNDIFITRPYYKPAQPVTPARLARWKKFRNGVLAWQALSPVQKGTWNKLGDMFNYEGFNRFMSKFLKS